MDTIRALRASTAASQLQQGTLEPDTLLRLHRAPTGIPVTVFVLAQDDLASLASGLPAGLLADRGMKHPASPLGRYFAGRPGLARLRADYREPGQAVRGIRTLLEALKQAGSPTAAVLGVETKLFDALWSRALPALEPAPRTVVTPAAAPSLETLLAQHPNLTVPDRLRQAFMGQSPAIEAIRRRIVLAARHDSPVLIEGETGTGKEVVARQIHELSERRLRPFIPVNCGGIPGELFESELFGHCRGAFTGALFNKEGLWTAAGAGTLFLDEIGDLTPAHQVRLLRALETGRYRPVGGREEITSEARVISATNRRLRTLVEAGRFREDLYYRLDGLRIHTPALRGHKEDLPELAAHFWRRAARDTAAPLPPDALAELTAYDWPGNARELRAFCVNLATLADGQAATATLVRALLLDRLGPLTQPERDP